MKLVLLAIWQKLSEGGGNKIFRLNHVLRHTWKQLILALEILYLEPGTQPSKSVQFVKDGLLLDVGQSIAWFVILQMRFYFHVVGIQAH